MLIHKGFILTDIAGLHLTKEDQDIIRHPAMFGIILFTRNYESIHQLRSLTQSIHNINPAIVIMVDQEGGRVQRFRDGFSTLKPMSYWGNRYDENPTAAMEGLRQQTITMVTELKDCGVQASLAPVLDINYGMSDVIGERSFHHQPPVITQLARCAIDTMHQFKMPSMGKHFPGHGGVTLDSHLTLPIDDRPWQAIWEQDMWPYRELIHELDSIMPAHILYPALDDKPAGFSYEWITDVLRKKLNYQGIVITDDLSMEGAVEIGSYNQRAALARTAGCDVLTICNNRRGALEVIDRYKDYLEPQSSLRIANYLRNLS